MSERRLIVYIVDDDEAVRDSLFNLLSSKGFQTEAFPSAPEFLQSFDVRRAGCVVTDIRMPGMSGLELQSKLLESGHDVPVIVMTGNADVAGAVRALKSGALDYVEKPIDSENLIAAIRSGLTRRAKLMTMHETADAARNKIAELTPRETDVLRHLIAGHPNKIIAFELGISPRTVENHRAHLMLKMQANSVADLVKIAIAAGVTAAESRNT